MERVTLLPPEKLTDGWIDPQYIPEGENKYYLRNRQVKRPAGGWRHLKSDEIERLVKNDNTAASWDTLWVTDDFDPRMVKNNKFYGTVRIGRIGYNALQFHDLRLPVGITNSSIHSCDIGDDVAIHDVHYLSHYIIGDRCMLFNIQEMCTTDHAKFGNGIIKDGEEEKVRVRIHIMNETGCRSVMPFDGMITADAYLWGKYIDDRELQQRLEVMTQAMVDHRRGYYGTIGEGCVIKNSSIIKDVKIGSHCYIKGASKLKNITINSSNDEPSQIGENVILVNGIVGYGCRIFYSCVAVKFVLGNNCNLKYGARLIDSVMGDNSTISCCEVLNNLIFPAHEQHHNNSFLIASVIMGQSNMAAGATLGSNHNSRTNDNELVAGRGFWPGLCCSVKHSSVFASFNLLSKSDFPYEMNIPFPFALVNNNVKADELEVIPAFWWMYNMYALTRNTWKYEARDKRRTKVQHIEFNTFAPDSMEEVAKAMRLLEEWTAKAWLRVNGQEQCGTEEEMCAKGRKLLHGEKAIVDTLEVWGEQMEKSKRRVRICKVFQAYRAYEEMLVHYLATNMLDYTSAHPDVPLCKLMNEMHHRSRAAWMNLGGQLMRVDDFDTLRKDIREGRLGTWYEIHQRYDELWMRYPLDRLCNAYHLLCERMGVAQLSSEQWQELWLREADIQQYIREQVYASRKKDDENPFRRATYRNEEEMDAAIVKAEDNDFVQHTDEQVTVRLAQIKDLAKRMLQEE